MGMKLAVYNVLVNRKKLIKTKFEAYTNSDSGKRAGTFKKMKYLAGLNFSYYILLLIFLSILYLFLCL